MARSFNGSTYITADGAGVANMNNLFTLAAWVKAAGSVTNSDWYAEGSSSSNSPFFRFQCNSGKLRVIMRRDGNTGTADQTIVSTATFADSTWHHAVYAQTGTGSSLSWQVYIDGQPDTGTFGASHTCTLNRLTMGGLRRTGGLEAGITASVAELATWTRVLTAEEAAALAAGLPPSLLAPIHYWPLWGVDSPEADIVGGGTNGTLVGPPGYDNGPPVYLPRFAPLYAHSAVATGAISKAGHGIAELVGGGDGATTFAERSSGIAGSVGSGGKLVPGISVKTGTGNANIVGAGASVSVKIESGKGDIGTVAAGRNQTGAAVAAVAGRVLIAFDDDPLTIEPTWTALDRGGDFPQNFVSGYDIQTGRQTLLAQTDTGTATVFISDHETALFDPRNTTSPYFGKLDGRQIQLQLYDPVRDVWEPQFRGFIDEVSYDIDPAVNADGEPVNASIQLQCVDIFDFLAGFGLTPGLDGVTPRTVPSGSAGGPPPAGGEDGVWYAQTEGTVDDRITQILMDVTNDAFWVAERAVIFSGNVSVQAVKYDPDESALVALRDACDAEFPFIANMYVDRYGRFVFHGRYGRFDAPGVSADAGVERWNFHSWKVGDGKAIQADSSRAQMRVLSYGRGRQDIVNVAVCYPANMKATQMPNQVFANTSSISSYGKHAAPPMSDLLTAHPIFDDMHGGPSERNAECAAFAELLVKNQKDPRETITAIQVKSLHPDDSRAANVWALLSQADVSDTLNIAVGYPGGTGFTGASPDDDYFVEGRKMQVRPLEPGFDYVELDLELSPYVWSADTHNVFPDRA